MPTLKLNKAYQETINTIKTALSVSKNAHCNLEISKKALKTEDGKLFQAGASNAFTEISQDPQRQYFNIKYHKGNVFDALLQNDSGTYTKKRFFIKQNQEESVSVNKVILKVFNILKQDNIKQIEKKQKAVEIMTALYGRAGKWAAKVAETIKEFRILP